VGVEAPEEIDLPLLTRIAGRHASARLVVLFGSVARGTPLPWSDADFGVLGGTWIERLKLGAELGRALGREAHVVDLERAPEALRQEIARHGLLLREAAPGTWADYRAESFVRWFDVAPLRRLCAEGVRRRLRQAVRHG
jgi:predicted nucleotidyltransferase